MFDAIKQELRRPATIIGIIVGLIGILAGGFISFYFYYKSIKEGIIYYKVEQIQAFDNNNNEKNTPNVKEVLYVVDENGNRIDRNVYAANVRVWNGGNAEIRKEEVRKPFKIIVSGINTFINISLKDATNENIGGFSVSEKGEIDWKNFDPKEGVLIRVVYANDSKQDIYINGYALNSNIPYSIDNFDKDIDWYLSYFYYILCIIVIIIGVSHFNISFKRKFSGSLFHKITNYFSRPEGIINILGASTSLGFCLITLVHHLIRAIYSPSYPPL